MNPSEFTGDERPDPRFVEHLEWELARAVRREARFGSPPERAPRRVGRLTAALLLAVTVGASSVLAAQELRRSQAANLLGEHYRVRLEIAALHADAVRAELERLEVARASGIVSAPALAEARGRAEDAAHETALLRLDAEEVAVTGREPDRRLSAPLVAGRDFVTLRLDETLGALQRRDALATESAERLSLLHERGFTSAQEIERARASAAERAGRIASVATRRGLRARFLAGEVDAVRADLLGLKAESRARLASAQAELERSRGVAARLALLAANGRATEAESRAAAAEVRSNEARLRLAELEIATLSARLAETR